DVADAHAGSAQETPIFGEPNVASEPVWPLNLLSALFETDVDYVSSVREAITSAGLDVLPTLHTEAVAEQDWVRSTQQQFGPIEISPRLWIVPSWCDPVSAQAVNLRLDPGLAFGTGSHPTTWQCLRWLDENLAIGASLLDYGCGSGILAIAAQKLGAGPVIGIDVDNNAVAASRENAAKNQAAATFFSPEHLTDQAFDVVIANILANPLRVLAPLLARRTRIGGQICLAGILDAQALSVQEAYSAWFELNTLYPRDGWTCLAGVRTH
ncbi:MAG: 50S ribosomal protein L11 methyltransferase, partial [Betaproteobacteria bacterium]